MSSIVRVFFSQQGQYEFVAKPLPARPEANQWLDEQWEDLGCEASHPMGKTLVLDKVLGIALNGGEKRFAEGGAWAQRYADVVATLLDRPVISVNVAERVVG